MASSRTASHFIPQEETTAMERFYHLKRCVIEKKLGAVKWAHMLDAALDTSNDRLAEMLRRNLRDDQHPSHAAEVRENILPLTSYHHLALDAHPPRSTLFLHEDTLARTLSYEQQLQRWRIAELESGRGDPGRPEYEAVFGGMRVTEHRYHGANNLEPFLRMEENSTNTYIYRYTDCPGIDNPVNQFPVVETLLSIPFSLLHTLPRLIALVPPTRYQQELIAMAYEIVMLWWWEPSPDQIARGTTSFPKNTRRTPPPKAIHLLRNTFSATKPIITFGTAPAQSSSSTLHHSSIMLPHHVPRSIELPSGQILCGTMPSVSLDTEGLLLTSGDQGSVEPTGITCPNKGFVISSALSSASGTRDVQTEAGDNSDVIGESAEAPDVDGKSEICSPLVDIISWYEKVVGCVSEPLPPLTPTPFERGVIGGQSVNDVLMIKGLIPPPTYLHFFDLSSFSLSPFLES